MTKYSNYSEAVEDIGNELAAALLEEEYNQFIRGIEPAPATSYPFDAFSFDTISNDYIDYIEAVGYRKVGLNHEKLYRMEKGI